MIIKKIIINNSNFRQIPELMQQAANSGTAFVILNIQPMSNDIPPQDQLIPYLEKGIIIANDQGLKIKIKNLPYCLSSGLTRYLINTEMPEQKYKGADCQNCTFNNKCTGAWKQYLNYQFKPIKLNTDELSRNKLFTDINSKIEQLKEKNIIIITATDRNKYFPQIKLIDILNSLFKNNYLFHATSEIHQTLIPHQASGIWEHGNQVAVYATADPNIAIFYSLYNRGKINEQSFSIICSIRQGLIKKNIIYATKDIKDNLAKGYIHILPADQFSFINDEYLTKKEITPVFIFEVTKSDINTDIYPVPFLETPYTPQKLFDKQERKIIRQYIYSLNGNNTLHHGFSHIYRVSEMAFDLALNECPQKANDIFLAACFHDLARTNDKPEKDHAIKIIPLTENLLKKYWPSADIDLILRAVKEHENIITTDDKSIGCLLDADRLDLFRCGIEPKPQLLSTDSGKKILGQIKAKYDLNNFHNKWPSIFKEFLTQNKINHY